VLAGAAALGEGWPGALGLPRVGNGGIVGGGVMHRPVGDPKGEARGPRAGGPWGAARAVRGGVKQVDLRELAKLPPRAW
jgi:hypothetical protein